MHAGEARREQNVRTGLGDREEYVAASG
jgi:hypothetical protein